MSFWQSFRPNNNNNNMADSRFGRSDAERNPNQYNRGNYNQPTGPPSQRNYDAVQQSSPGNRFANNNSSNSSQYNVRDEYSSSSYSNYNSEATFSRRSDNNQWQQQQPQYNNDNNNYSKNRNAKSNNNNNALFKRRGDFSRNDWEKSSDRSSGYKATNDSIAGYNKNSGFRNNQEVDKNFGFRNNQQMGDSSGFGNNPQFDGNSGFGNNQQSAGTYGGGHDNNSAFRNNQKSGNNFAGSDNYTDFRNNQVDGNNFSGFDNNDNFDSGRNCPNFENPIQAEKSGPGWTLSARSGDYDEQIEWGRFNKIPRMENNFASANFSNSSVASTSRMMPPSSQNKNNNKNNPGGNNMYNAGGNNKNNVGGNNKNNVGGNNKNNVGGNNKNNVGGNNKNNVGGNNKNQSKKKKPDDKFIARRRKANMRHQEAKTLVATGVIKKPPKGLTKAEPEKYWREWWTKYAYIENAVEKVDENDEAVKEFIKFSYEPSDPKFAIRTKLLLKVGTGKIKRTLNINETNYAFRDVYKLFVYKKHLEDPNFQKHLDNKDRCNVLTYLSYLNDTVKYALMLQSLINTWNHSKEVLEGTSEEQGKGLTGKANKLMNDKLFHYLVLDNIRQLKVITAHDWPGFNDFYKTLVSSDKTN